MHPIPCNRWQRRPTERRAEILAAARIVFGSEGFARATLAQVARKAGVSSATISHYFGSKAALFEALVEEEALEFVAVDPLIVSENGGYRALLHGLVLDRLRRLNQPGTPELTLTVLGEIRDFPVSAQRLFRQLSQRGRERLQTVIAAGQTAGEFEVADPATTSHVIVALLLGAVLDSHFVSECTDTAQCRDRVQSAILIAVDQLVGASAPSIDPDHHPINNLAVAATEPTEL